MRKTILFLSLLTAFLVTMVSCKDNDKVFDTPITDDMFSFKPIEGGAVMNYKITDPSVSKVKVEYVTDLGLSIYKKGDYAADTLLLDGFAQAQNGVEAKVSFLNNRGEESEVKIYKFNTLASSLYSFFDNLKVDSYWDGFSLTYQVKGYVNGSATVSFVGENPNTHGIDTLLLENFTLESTEKPQLKLFTIDESQRQPEYTVVISTEDANLNVIRKEVYEGVKGIGREMIPNNKNGEPLFELLDPFGKSKETPEPILEARDGRPGALSWKYLFDGDTKGARSFDYYNKSYATPPFTFLTKEDGINTPDNNVYFVLDLKQKAMVGEMRFYSRYRDDAKVNSDFVGYDFSYYFRLPCNIQVYAWTADEPYDVNADQSTIPDSNWKLMGTFEQDPQAASTDRWYYIKSKNDYKYSVKSKAECQEMEPLFAPIFFDFDENEYRYFKIVFGATYYPDRYLYAPYYINTYNMVTCHEIEVYAKSK